MSRSLGIVVPAYDPDVERLTAYLAALESLDPATIRIELDAPSPAVLAALEAHLDEADEGSVDEPPADDRSADERPAEERSGGERPADVELSVARDRRGKGAAVTAGFEALSTDVYAFADADGSTPVEQLGAVLDPVRTGAVDLAVGSRRHPDAEVTASQSRVRERLGDAYAWLARQVLPVALYDYQCGAKAIDAAAWERVRGDLYQSGFGWDVEFVSAAVLRGCTIAEVPIEWADAPNSTVDPLAATPSLFSALFRVQRLRLLDSTGGRPLLDRLAETSDVAPARENRP